MKLTGLSIGKSVIVIHTIGNIAVLLSFQDHQAALDRVDSSGIDLDKVPLLHRYFTDQL